MIIYDAAAFCKSSQDWRGEMGFWWTNREGRPAGGPGGEEQSMGQRQQPKLGVQPEHRCDVAENIGVMGLTVKHSGQAVE